MENAVDRYAGPVRLATQCNEIIRATRAALVKTDRLIAMNDEPMTDLQQTVHRLDVLDAEETLRTLREWRDEHNAKAPSYLRVEPDDFTDLVS